MLLRIGFDIVFTVTAPTPMILLLYVHPDRAGDLQQTERIEVEPSVVIEDYIDSFGNRVGRIVAPPGQIRLTYDNVICDSGAPEPAFPGLQQLPVEALPSETLQYLLASRYCEVDLMSDIAWNLFQSTPPGWARVQAICDWVHSHIQFGYEHARATKTALEVYHEGRGVCRDFTHLAITFCRCMNIPARYATGYLSDVGFPVNPSPMDFSAFFEVFLDGAWHPFDARNNARRIGRVLMARGRDAADTALTTSFYPANLEKFLVWTDPVEK
jgi:transglutaminase-like putative cysteine protease